MLALFGGYSNCYKVSDTMGGGILQFQSVDEVAAFEKLVEEEAHRVLDTLRSLIRSHDIIVIAGLHRNKPISEALTYDYISTLDIFIYENCNLPPLWVDSLIIIVNGVSWIEIDEIKPFIQLAIEKGLQNKKKFCY